MKNLPLMYLDAKPPKLLQTFDQYPANRGNYILPWVGYILDFVKHDTGRLVNAEQANNGGHNRGDSEEREVGSGKQERIIVLNTIGRVVVLDLDGLVLIVLGLEYDGGGRHSFIGGRRGIGRGVCRRRRRRFLAGAGHVDATMGRTAVGFGSRWDV